MSTATPTAVAPAMPAPATLFSSRSTTRRPRLGLPLLLVALGVLTGLGAGFLVLLAVVVAGLSLLTLSNPRVTVLAILPLTLLLPPQGPSATRALVFLSAAAFVLLGGRADREPAHRARAAPRSFVVCAVTFLVLAVLLALTHDHPGRRVATFQLVEPFLIMFVLVRALRDRSDVRLLITWLTVAMTVASLIACYEFVRGTHLFFQGPAFFFPQPRLQHRRAQAVFPHPIVLGTSLTLVLPLAVAQLQASRSWIARKALFLSIVLMGMALVFTLSRGPWVGAALALCAMALVLGGRKGVLVVAATVLGLLILLSSPIGGDASSLLRSVVNFQQTSKEDPNVGARVALSRIVIPYVIENPEGRGPGGKSELRLVGSFKGFAHDFASSIDNDYLVLLIEEGVVGFLLYVFMLGTLLLLALRGGRRLRSDPELGPVSAAFAGSLVAVLFVSATVATWTTWRQIATLFGLLAGGILALNRLRQESETTDR